MDIIIYRQSVNDLINIFNYISSILSKSKYFIINRNKFIIRSKKCWISFYCGNYDKMKGTRPKYYNTDSLEASYFLQQGACKVNGEEIKDIEELCNIIINLDGGDQNGYKKNENL